jgi:glycosyltransferase involved in cell wall biosynthesis
MSAVMAAHLDDQFKEGKGDLYAAFIVRCAELTDMGGKVAMVTQQSFMFISSYEDLRAKLRAGFAVEAMALGKPVVAYIRKPDAYLPKGIRCPIVSANPDVLKQTLVSLIENPELRRDLGAQGRQYVEEVFSLERVGERMADLYGRLGFRTPMMEGIR